MRRIDLVLATYFALLIAKALYPSKLIPVRHYDMFAYALPPRRLRTVMLFHADNGETRVIPAACVLPYEPARNTSILRHAADEGPAAIRELGTATLTAQRRGWRSFDQVWGPPQPAVTSASSVCIHIVDEQELNILAFADHSKCRVTLSDTREK